MSPKIPLPIKYYYRRTYVELHYLDIYICIIIRYLITILIIGAQADMLVKIYNLGTVKKYSNFERRWNRDIPHMAG